MARLRSSDRYERSLIVVAADHGVSFRPGAPYRDADDANLPQIASIPLMIKAPGQQRGRIDDANVKTTDVLPTVASELGVSRHGKSTAGQPGRGGRRAGSLSRLSTTWKAFRRPSATSSAGATR